MTDGKRDTLLSLDIETMPDMALVPPDWPADQFPKPPWHRVVAISFVEATIAGVAGFERYEINRCGGKGRGGLAERGGVSRRPVSGPAGSG